MIGLPEVAWALQERDAKGSDSDTKDGHLIVAHETGPGWWNQSEQAGTIRAEGENRPSRPSHIITHALRSEGADASEDGTGRGGTPMVLAATLVTAAVTAADLEPDEHLVVQPDVEIWNQTCGCGFDFIGPLTQPCPRCRRIRDGYTHGDPIAFSSKDRDADAGEISPTLRSMNFAESHINGGGQVAIAFEPRYYTRDNETGGAPDETVGITNAHKAGDSAPVVFESRVARNGRGAPSDIVPPLKAESGQTGKGDSAPLIAFDHCVQGSERTFIHRKNEKAQLQGNRPDSVAGNFGVRRLTPRECERLQGFTDDFTRWDAEGKEISDSARYRMLGNAVCVNVAYWIGKRIVKTGVQ